MAQRRIRFSLFTYLAFCLLVLTLPFEEIRVGVLSLGRGFFSVSKLAGLGLFGWSLLTPRLAFRKPTPELMAFAAYILVFFAFGVVQDVTLLRSVISRGLSLSLCLLLMWIGYSLLHRERIAGLIVSLIALSSGVLSLGILLGGVPMQGGPGVRLTAEGVDPNVLAASLSLGVICSTGLGFVIQPSPRWWTRMVALLGAGSMIAAIVLTGSRGAVVAVAAGLTCLFLGDVDRWWKLLRAALASKVRVLAVISVGLVFIIAFSVAYGPARERWVRTITENSMAGREVIWPEAASMILESPLVGWGPIQHWQELGQRTGRSMRDTHNLYLSLLTETGIIGATPFFIGLFLVFARALRARATKHGTLPLAALACVLATNLSVTWQLSKVFWLVLGYCAAAGRDRLRSPVASDGLAKLDESCAL